MSKPRFSLQGSPLGVASPGPSRQAAPLLLDTSGKEGPFCTTVRIYCAKNSTKTVRMYKTFVVFLCQLKI